MNFENDESGVPDHIIVQVVRNGIKLPTMVFPINEVNSIPMTVIAMDKTAQFYEQVVPALQSDEVSEEAS